MIVLGFDPGLTGAVARLDPLSLTVTDMPTCDGWLDEHTLAALVNGAGADLAVIEIQQAYPKQGLSSAFKTGQNYGTLLTVIALACLPIQKVTAAKWTAALHVGADKDTHRRRAMDLWPSQAALFARKKDDGRADAALIALWGLEQRSRTVA